ncbi:MAG: hypothetical protein L0323_14790 [Planctomycetes bacterium]|nr:hypothetical protein [Planctomycetota bacterium]
MFSILRSTRRSRPRDGSGVRASLWIALLAGCRATPDAGAERSDGSSRGTLAARFAACAPAAGPLLGLHLIEADRPDRPRGTPAASPRDLAPPSFLRTAALPRAESVAAEGPEETSAAPEAAPILERALYPNEYEWPKSPGDTLERIGRGMARDDGAGRNFALLRLLDRYHRSAPDAADPLAITEQDLDVEARTRFLDSRAKKTVRSRLREALEETELIGPVLGGAERLPQTGIEVLETVVDGVTGDESNFGELRLRMKGGLFRSPSRMLSLHYSAGPLKADFYPTQAKVRVARSIAGFRVSLQGDVDYADPSPTARIEVTRRLGREWRLRLSAGSGVGQTTLPLFTTWPGEGEDSDSRRGAVAFFERRF